MCHFCRGPCKHIRSQQQETVIFEIFEVCTSVFYWDPFSLKYPVSSKLQKEWGPPIRPAKGSALHHCTLQVMCGGLFNLTPCFDKSFLSCQNKKTTKQNYRHMNMNKHETGENQKRWAWGDDDDEVKWRQLWIATWTWQQNMKADVHRSVCLRLPSVEGNSFVLPPPWSSLFHSLLTESL